MKKKRNKNKKLDDTLVKPYIILGPRSREVGGEGEKCRNKPAAHATTD